MTLISNAFTCIVVIYLIYYDPDTYFTGIHLQDAGPSSEQDIHSV